MKKVYLVKKDVNKKTSSDNWIQMNGHEFYLFMQTEEGKSRCASFGRLDGCEGGDTIIIAECGADVAKQWRNENDVRAYREKLRKASGYTTFSCSQAAFADGEIITEEWIRDEGPSVEDQVIRKMEFEELHSLVDQLPDIEKTVIEELFFHMDRTEKKVGELLGLSKGKVNYIKSKALERLKKMLSQEGNRILAKPTDDDDNKIGSTSMWRARRWEDAL